MKSSKVFAPVSLALHRLALAGALATPLLLAGCTPTFYDVKAQIEAGSVTAARLHAVVGEATEPINRGCLLYGAIVVGDVPLARDLLRAGVHYTSSCKDATRVSSYLHRAILTDNDQMVAVLLQKSDEGELEDTFNAPDRRTPLLRAAARRNAKIVRLLLEAGADPRAPDPFDLATALDLAARPDVTDLELATNPTEVEQLLLAVGLSRTDPETRRENARKQAEKGRAFRKWLTETEAEIAEKARAEERRRAAARERTRQEDAEDAQAAEIARREADRRAYQEKLRGERARGAEEPARPVGKSSEPLTLTGENNTPYVDTAQPYKPPPPPTAWPRTPPVVIHRCPPQANGATCVRGK
jgi:hypothetical protein